jgi:hypothetical protein
VNTKQRKTLQRLFQTPTPAEIGWDDPVSLFTALGATITEGSGSRVRVTLNGADFHAHVPHPKRICTRPVIRGVRDFLIAVEVKP